MLSAQTDMTPGYKMLEKGELDNAVVFFSQVVEEQPQNKTANICLGRAVGLSGDPVKALSIFAEADKIYPNDFELGLNIAEAYLWNKLPSESLNVYQSLLEKDNKNYTANLGTANCYYELMEYEKALFYIDEAIKLDPKNQGTYNSKKYILLASAAQKTNQFDYRGAIDLLNSILEFKPLDGHALLNKGINFIQLENYKLAENSFQILLDNEIELVESNILLSHLSMLKHQEKEAVRYAEESILAAVSESESQQLRAGVQKLNALGASKKFKEAFLFLDELNEEFGEQEELVMAKARLSVWDREVNDGLEIYESLESSFNVYMGKAEAYIALSKYNDALIAINEALIINPSNKDALNLKGELEAKKKMSVELGGNISTDAGGNEANEVYLRFNIPSGDKHLFYVHAGLRGTENKVLNTSADQYQLFVGDQYKINHLLTFSTAVGAISSENNLETRSLNVIANTDLKYQFAKNHALSFSYNRASLQYSSDLIKSGLISNQYAGTYQFAAPKKPGLVTQVSRSQFSDGNSNLSLFASLYYEISSFPMIKVGANATHLTFSEQKPISYFSPDVFQMAELFFQAGNIYDKKAKFTYSAMIAIGKQRISDNALETIQRVDIQLGYRVSSKLVLNVNYFTNSAATSTLKAYSFQRVGLKLVRVL